MIQLSMVTRGK